MSYRLMKPKGQVYHKTGKKSAILPEFEKFESSEWRTNWEEEMATKETSLKMINRVSIVMPSMCSIDPTFVAFVSSSFDSTAPLFTLHFVLTKFLAECTFVDCRRRVEKPRPDHSLILSSGSILGREFSG